MHFFCQPPDGGVCKGLIDSKSGLCEDHVCRFIELFCYVVVDINDVFAVYDCY